MTEHSAFNIALRQALLASCGENTQKFKAVYTLTYSRFFAITSAKVKDSALVEDILQKTYVSIWKARETYDPDRAEAFTWMLVILRNRTIDAVRSRRKVSATRPIDNLEIENPSSEIATRDVHTREHLKHCLEDLPNHVREAIILNIGYGYTSKEIGERMDVPANTVRSWVRRGLKDAREKAPFAFNQIF